MKCPYCNKIINTKELRMRSLPQNKYYWGCVVEVLSDELGYTRNEIHEILKQKFLSEPVFLKTKEGTKEIRISKSTVDLDTIKMEDFLSSVRQWASIELGIYLPLPNET